MESSMEKILKQTNKTPLDILNMFPLGIQQGKWQLLVHRGLGGLDQCTLHGCLKNNHAKPPEFVQLNVSIKSPNSYIITGNRFC